MSYAEFFSEQKAEEGDPGFVAGPGSEELYQRTSGLEKFVNNFRLMLDIPASQIKVACVHPIGEPCIPNILGKMLGGYNPYTRRLRRDGGAGAREDSVGAWKVETEIIPPNGVNETGSGGAYAENVAWLRNITAVVADVTEDTAFGAKLSNASGVGKVAGVAVTEQFGDTASERAVR